MPSMTRFVCLAASAATIALTIASQAAAQQSRQAAAELPLWFGGVANAAPHARGDLQDELRQLKAAVLKRSPEDVGRVRWWAAGGPAHRWNEIILAEMTETFGTVPLALRNLALFHAALDDAATAARASKNAAARRAPHAADSTIAPVGPAPGAGASEYAAVAAAAGEMLAWLYPAKAAVFAAKAEEAINARLLSGHEYPSEIAEGRAIGKRVAMLAIERGKADGADAKWTGAVPDGVGKWRGQNPIAPLAGTWRPWVLDRADEFRPAAPPAADSAATQAALAELKAFARTPKTNHRATFWEVHGGARVHMLWNDMARMKLLEQGEMLPPFAGSRILAALNIALADAAVACWDAKYAYWHIRPSQLDPDVKPLFAPPNHPSFPAAHGCLSTAAATVLAEAFPMDRDAILALGKEAAEARVWAGIHYRYDIDAGQALGRAVGEKTIARAFKRKSS